MPIGEPTPYATISGPKTGPYLARDVLGPIGVIEYGSLLPLPIGQAHHVGQDEAGAAYWFLIVNRRDLPGWYIVRDRRFVLAMEQGDPPPWHRPKGQ